MLAAQTSASFFLASCLLEGGQIDLHGGFGCKICLPYLQLTNFAVILEMISPRVVNDGLESDHARGVLDRHRSAVL